MWRVSDWPPSSGGSSLGIDSSGSDVGSDGSGGSSSESSRIIQGNFFCSYGEAPLVSIFSSLTQF